MRRKISIPILAIIFLVAFASYSFAIQIAGLEIEPLELKQADFTVTITDDDGNTTNTVRISDPWTPTTYGYWVRADLGSAGCSATSAIVIIIVDHKDNAHKMQTYTYNSYLDDLPGIFGPSFSVSDWEGSGDVGGGLVLVVTNWGEVGYAFFGLKK